MIALLAGGGQRMSFNVTYQDILRLPVRLRDAMIRQVNEWRAQEE